MTSWKERLVAIGLAGGLGAGCTLTKDIPGYVMNSAPDPCFEAADPVQCSTDRAAGNCTNVPDKCCGKPDSIICKSNVCQTNDPFYPDDCCTAADPTACALAACAGQVSYCPAAPPADAATEDGGAGD